MAGLSNISAAKADGSFSLAMSDPQTTRAVIGQVDKYTPIGNDAAIYDAETNTTLALSNGYLEKQQVVLTNITDRTDRTVAAAAPVALDNSSKTINYTVGSGDTLSGIGWKYGVELASLKYVNDITDVDSIQPGQSLKVPPVGYTVSESKIAQKDKKLALASRATTTRSSSSSRDASTVSNNGRRLGFGGMGYAPGYCTEYAAEVSGVPGGLGNGGQWYRNAQARGMSTGTTPRVGAVFVTGESWAGHVGVVTGVNSDGSFTTTEMNYEGWGIVSSRTMSPYAVKGFIY